MGNLNKRLDDLLLKVGGPIIWGYQWDWGDIRGDDGELYDTPQEFFEKYPHGRVINFLCPSVISYNSEGIILGPGNLKGVRIIDL